MPCHAIQEKTSGVHIPASFYQCCDKSQIILALNINISKHTLTLLTKIFMHHTCTMLLFIQVEIFTCDTAKAGRH